MTVATELRPVEIRPGATRTDVPVTPREPPAPVSDRWPYPVRSPRDS